MDNSVTLGKARRPVPGGRKMKSVSRTFAVSRRGLCARATAGIRLGDVFLVRALEIGLIPAAALETKTRSRNQFLQCGFPTGRAVCQRWIADFPQLLQFVPAFGTAVFVNRHRFSSGQACKARDYSSHARICRYFTHRAGEKESRRPTGYNPPHAHTPYRTPRENRQRP